MLRSLFATACLAPALTLGCASTTTDTDTKPMGEACPKCAAGEHCEMCASGKDCPKCGKHKDAHDKMSCAHCAEGKTCADCSAKPAGDQKQAIDEAMNEAAADIDTARADDQSVATIKARGMSCPLCASNADRRLNKLSGVEWVDIDLGKGEVNVGLADSGQTPTDEELKTAIEDAGFTAESVTMPATKEQP